MIDKRELIFNTITDLVSDFLYYDRKEDQALPRGDIQNAIIKGIITVEEIVGAFEDEIKKGLK